MRLGRALGLLAAARGVYRPLAEVAQYVSRFEGLPFVLVHVPKNGGTSILDAVGLRRPRVHATAWEMRSVCGDDLAGKELIAVYRDPVARFVSASRYYERGGNGGNDDRRMQERFVRHASAGGLASYEGLKELALMNRAFWPQSAYLLDPYGDLAVGRVFRIEGLADTFDEYARSRGAKLPRLQRINAAEGGDSGLSEATLDAVHSLYECDYELARRFEIGPPS